MGCLVMEGGASQVDQETRTLHRGTRSSEWCSPPPSVNGGTCRVSSQLLCCLANRGGCLPCTFLTPLVVSPTALHDSTSSPTLLYSPAPPSSAASVAEHIPSYAGSRLIGLRAVCKKVLYCTVGRRQQVLYCSNM